MASFPNIFLIFLIEWSVCSECKNTHTHKHTQIHTHPQSDESISVPLFYINADLQIHSLGNVNLRN